MDEWQVAREGDTGSIPAIVVGVQLPVSICGCSSAEEYLATNQAVEGSNPSSRSLNEELRLMKYVVDINTLIRNSVANPSEC